MQNPPATSNSPSPALSGIALFIAVFCLFLPSLRNGFINFDDPIYLLNNKNIQHGLDWATVRWAFTAGYSGNWNPLPWLSHALDWRLFGGRAWGHHLVNVVLHACSATLLFIALRKMTGAHWRSLFIAAVFGIHPLRVESVAWATERNDVLCVFFWMLTLLAYIEWAQKSANGKSGGRLFHALALGFFALGLMSKPMIVSLPFTLLLLDYWPLGRWLGREDMKRLVIEKIPFFALSLVVCLVTYHVRQQGGAIAIGVLNLGPGERIANACVSYIRYLGKFFVPIDLAVVYPLPLTGRWPVAAVLVSAAYLVVLTVAVLMRSRRQPYLFTGWFWYLGTLLPVIGLVRFDPQAMADRYTYVPTIGLAIALVWGVCEVARIWRLPQFALPSMAAVALAGCALITLRQISYWKDSETLFRHTLAVTQANPLAHLNLGCALADGGREHEAISQFQQALEINKGFPDVHFNFGLTLLEEKDFAGAAKHFKEELAGNPADDLAHYYLGIAFEAMREWDEAAAQFNEAARLNPNLEDAHFRLGLMLARQGKSDEAIAQFREALRLNPDFAAARAELDSLSTMQAAKQSSE